MKSFKSFFTESILDPERPTLSPQVFVLDSEPKLKDVARDQILSGIKTLSKSMQIIDYTMIGSTLTKRYTEDSDIDLNILILAAGDSMELAKKIAAENSGKFLTGTRHPINYHVLNDKKDFDTANDSADGVFDIAKNKFVRTPTESPFHVEQYFDAFKTVVSTLESLKTELKDALIDYSFLKTVQQQDASKLRRLIKNKLDEIEQDAQHLASLHDRIVLDRNKGFQKKLTPTEIQLYGTKNRLPGNVIYKLLERHHYLEFLHAVESVLDDGAISDDDAQKLLNIVF